MRKSRQERRAAEQAVRQLEWRLNHARERLAELRGWDVPPGKRALYGRFLSRLVDEIEEMEGQLQLARGELEDYEGGSYADHWQGARQGGHDHIT